MSKGVEERVMQVVKRFRPNSVETVKTKYGGFEV